SNEDIITEAIKNIFKYIWKLKVDYKIIAKTIRGNLLAKELLIDSGMVFLIEESINNVDIRIYEREFRFCPVCKNQMIIGRVDQTGIGSVPLHWFLDKHKINWLEDEDLTNIKKKIKIKRSTTNNYTHGYNEAYLCTRCNKVTLEL
ncbi:MAG: PF20097 family protein, partial [Clostridium sp.]